MSIKTRTKERELRKWLAEERERSKVVDRSLLEQSRTHRALQKRTKIGRFIIIR